MDFEFQDPPLSSLTCSQAHQRLPWIGKAMPNNNGDPIILLDYCLSRAFRGGTYPRVITSSVDEVTPANAGKYVDPERRLCKWLGRNYGCPATQLAPHIVILQVFIHVNGIVGQD